jgi:hypothetical protein
MTPSLDKWVRRVLRKSPTDGPGVYQNFGEPGPFNCHYILELPLDDSTLKVWYVVDEDIAHAIIIHAWRG